MISVLGEHATYFHVSLRQTSRNEYAFKFIQFAVCAVVHDGQHSPCIGRSLARTYQTRVYRTLLNFAVSGVGLRDQCMCKLLAMSMTCAWLGFLCMICIITSFIFSQPTYLWKLWLEREENLAKSDCLKILNLYDTNCWTRKPRRAVTPSPPPSFNFSK